MVSGSRYKFSCGIRGPFTAIRAISATAEERQTALSSHAAAVVLHEVGAEAREGSRHKLVGVAALLGESDVDERAETHSLLTRALAAVDDQKILLRAGWHSDAIVRSSPRPRPDVEWFPSSPAPRTVVEKPVTWVGIELRDKAGNPVPRAAYQIEFKGGTGTSGRLTEEGTAHVTGVPEGDCTIWFPEFPKALPGEPPPAKEVVMVRLHDDNATPMTNARFRVRVGGSTLVTGTSVTGWVKVELPADSCPERILVEWGEAGAGGSFPYATPIFVDCSAGGDGEQARTKLNNLGYPIDDMDAAVRAFQSHYGLDEEGLAPGGTLPPATKAKLDDLFAADCDASRPLPPEDDADPSADDPDASTDTTGTGGCEIDDGAES